MISPTAIIRIATAAIALGAYFAPSDAWPLVLALVAAVVGAVPPAVDATYRRALNRLDDRPGP